MSYSCVCTLNSAGPAASTAFVVNSQFALVSFPAGAGSSLVSLVQGSQTHIAQRAKWGLIK